MLHQVMNHGIRKICFLIKHNFLWAIKVDDVVFKDEFYNDNRYICAKKISFNSFGGIVFSYHKCLLFNY